MRKGLVIVLLGGGCVLASAAAAGEHAKIVIGLVCDAEGSHGSAVEAGVRRALDELSVQPELIIQVTPGSWRGVGEVVRDLYVRDGAIAVISGLDGQGSHVAAQIATKVRMPLLVPGGGPDLLQHTGVPWVLPVRDDDQWRLGEDALLRDDARRPRVSPEEFPAYIAGSLIARAIRISGGDPDKAGVAIVAIYSEPPPVAPRAPQ